MREFFHGNNKERERGRESEEVGEGVRAVKWQIHGKQTLQQLKTTCYHLWHLHAKHLNAHTVAGLFETASRT